MPRTKQRSSTIPVAETANPSSCQSITMSISAMEASRDSYLEAIPIAMGGFARHDGQFYIVHANRQFHGLYGSGASDNARPLRNRAALTNEITAFLNSEETLLEKEWLEGGGVGQRVFTLRIARRQPMSADEAECIACLLDRTAAVAAERSLRTELLRDSLTGLPNRLAFVEALEEAFELEGREIAVLIIDLKRFSRVNESMGAMAGDELIITVASRLVGALRRGDMLGRMGDDEFAVLLNLRNGPDDALAAADRVFDILSTPFRLSEMEIRIDVALGYALHEPGIGAAELIRNAQVAMKRAKVTNHVERYQPGEISHARRRFSLETELRRAMDADLLKFHFQPIVDLQTGSLSGYEALARWDHFEQGRIGPDEFIPVAEECGLIIPLGRRALRCAIATLADWDRRHGAEVPLRMSVNVSAVQLAQDDIPGFIASELRRTGISGSRLTLELTESAIIRDPALAARQLAELKELDLKIAMDDFGTGHSSLSALQRLPIDILKIDRSFVTGMLEDRDSVAIVRAILSLASTLGIATTAEGVETMELSQTLSALGCSYGQGYYYAPALDSTLAYSFFRAEC